jgi:prepilin peptidase CpaA
VHGSTFIPWLLVPDLLCVAVCLVATVTDVRAQRIPNWLTLPAAAAGLLGNALLFGLLGGTARAVGLGAVSSLAGLVLCLLVFGLLGAIHFLGFGDVKLMAAVGALLRWPMAIPALCDVAVAGGAVALMYALAHRRLGRVAGNLLRLGRRALRRREATPELHRIPYAVAILAGTAWAVAGRYLPVLRWP